MLKIRKISSISELDSLPALELNNWQWTCKTRPETRAHLAWIEGEGIAVKFHIEEKSPKMESQTPLTHVHEDSAVELFLSMTGEEKPGLSSMYLNFEANAAPVLYACTGAGRKGREKISPEEYELCKISSKIEEDFWEVSFLVPLSVLKRVCNISGLREGDCLWLNLYKLSEDEALEHYASYSKVELESPNFHRPDFFIKAVLDE
ncbi:carbohydrate-binding family 9-like protein [Clostridiaceae bacterium OttesenSCG-928-D20]|nr:carbohydrate-binding family 9-like protein [Clostridiaceae bacterium OttesenSCG-928-D20]